MIGIFGAPACTGSSHCWRPRAGTRSIDEVDLRLAQDLVGPFVAAGPARVYVGPSTGVTGPEGGVEALENHDDHPHLRPPAETGGGAGLDRPILARWR